MSDSKQDYQSFIQPIEDKMIRSVWRILQNSEDAEDAFQEAVATIFKRIDTIRSHNNPQALVLRICINAAFDALRKRNRSSRNEQFRQPVDLLSENAPNAADALQTKERQAEVAEAIALLPGQQSLAVAMRYLSETPYQDIADALGCEESTVRKHVSRGLEKLRSSLANLNPNRSPENA